MPMDFPKKTENVKSKNTFFLLYSQTHVILKKENKTYTVVMYKFPPKDLNRNKKLTKRKIGNQDTINTQN